MNKNIILKTVTITGVVFATVLSGTYVHAADDDPKYNSQYSYKVSASESGKSFESTESGKNSILVTGGTVNFSKSIISKSGDGAADDNTYYYGMNAAVLAVGSSKIKLMDSTIDTTGKRSDAVFSFGDSTIDISDSIINTAKDNSSALVAINGGTIKALNVVAETKGKSSSPIYIGKGGGSVSAGDCTFKAAGTDSPAITIQPEASSKNMTNVEVSLEKVTSETKDLLKISSTMQGRNRKNGARVNLSVMKSPLIGNISSDDISSLSIMFNKRTELIGSINSNKKAKHVSLMIDKSSRIVLTADSYVSELMNAVNDNSNIYTNGHKLFVGGKEVKGNSSKYEEWTYDFTTETTEPLKVEPEVVEEKKDKTGMFILLGVTSTAFLISLLSVFFIAKRSKSRAQRRAEQEVIAKAAKNSLKKPWEKA